MALKISYKEFIEVAYNELFSTLSTSWHLIRNLSVFKSLSLYTQANMTIRSCIHSYTDNQGNYLNLKLYLNLVLWREGDLVDTLNILIQGKCCLYKTRVGDDLLEEPLIVSVLEHCGELPHSVLDFSSNKLIGPLSETAICIDSAVFWRLQIDQLLLILQHENYALNSLLNQVACLNEQIQSNLKTFINVFNVFILII